MRIMRIYADPYPLSHRTGLSAIRNIPVILGIMFYPPDPEAVNRSIDKAGTIVFARLSLSDNYINNFRLHLFTASGMKIIRSPVRILITQNNINIPILLT